MINKYGKLIGAFIGERANIINVELYPSPEKSSKVSGRAAACEMDGWADYDRWADSGHRAVSRYASPRRSSWESIFLDTVPVLRYI